MKKYHLYNEFRGIEVYGDDLADALMRRGTIQRPDKYAEGCKIEDGEILTINTVEAEEDTTNSTRGNDKFVRVIITTTYGQLIPVDAKEIAVTISPLSVRDIPDDLRLAVRAKALQEGKTMQAKIIELMQAYISG